MKIKQACGLLAVVLLFMVLVPSPVQADTELEWTMVDKPGKEGNIVVTPSEVSEIAIGRNGVLYAVDRENSQVYRSLNAGVTWEDITSYLAGAGAELPASKIAVAPDKPGIVAVVTNEGSAVYVSTDGGVTWTDSSVPNLQGTIQAIAVSNEYTQGGKAFREIAIGTAMWGDGLTVGQVWVFQLGKLLALWQNQKLAIDPDYIGGEVSTIAFSPNYKRDRTILVIASTGGDVAPAYQNKTWLCSGKRNNSAGTTSWNDLTGYPVEIASAGDAPGVSHIYSSLALPSNYSGDEASSRRLFVSYDREPDADDDVYRLDDIALYRLNADGGADIDISSIAYYGTRTTGKLLAGDANPVAGSLNVQVRRTANPFDLSPTWQLSSVPPTGPGNAKVSWSPDGEIIYCGTGQSPGVSLDESAFSASLNGDEWRQLSLMDTLIKLADIAPSPDSESLFITTYSPFGPEGIWRSAGDPLGKYWQRLLTMDTITDAVILRLSASYSDDSTMYAAEAGGNLMAVSHNRGNTWQWCSTPEPVIDMVVYDEKTVYIALPEGYISKTIDGAWIWQDPVDTGLSEINMLSVAPDATILVGGRNGEVAYSTDGGDSFTRIYEAVDGSDVQVMADVDFEENRTIYVATDTPDSGIWRWMIDASDEWEQIDRSIIIRLAGGQCISGLAMGVEGTLYALRSEPASVNSGGMMRSLNPLALVPSIIEFDLVNQGLPEGTTFDPTMVFAHALPYLKLSEGAGQNELWSIDTANQIIYCFQDTLCKLGPRLDAPADGAIIPLDPCNCHITSLALYMEKLAGATRYEAAIYLDPSGTQGVWSGSSDDSEVDDFDAIIIHVDSTGLAQLSSGNTYYWQARAIEPIKSQWSDIWLFAPALGDTQQSSLTSSSGVSPSAGATNVPIRPAFTWHQVAGATGYEFVLARDGGFTDVVVAITGDNVLTSTAWGCDRDLDYSVTYFWKVRAVSATSHGDWVTNVFSVETAPTPSPSIPQVSITPPPPVEPVSTIPFYLLWIMIGTGIVLAAAVIILIRGTRY